MTPIADMVDGMVLAGATPHAIAVAVRSFEERDASRYVTSRVTLPSRSKAAIRAARHRAKIKQLQQQSGLSGVAMAAGKTVTVERDASRYGVTETPLSILPSLELSQGKPKEESKEVVQSTEPRARTKREKTRMADDWRPDEKGMKFARDRGLKPFEIETEITKFRNYWINRMDRDASKPRWDLAWQNWILNFRPAPNGQRNNVIAAADELVDTMRQWEKKDDLLEDLRSGEGASNVRLLSTHRGG